MLWTVFPKNSFNELASHIYLILLLHTLEWTAYLWCHILHWWSVHFSGPLEGFGIQHWEPGQPADPACGGWARSRGAGRTTGSCRWRSRCGMTPGWSRSWRSWCRLLRLLECNGRQKIGHDDGHSGNNSTLCRDVFVKTAFHTFFFSFGWQAWRKNVLHSIMKLIYNKLIHPPDSYCEWVIISLCKMAPLWSELLKMNNISRVSCHKTTK